MGLVDGLLLSRQFQHTARSIVVGIVDKIARHREIGFVRNRPLAGDIKPQLACENTVQPVDQDLIRYSLIAIAAESQVANLAAAQTPAGPIDGIHRLEPVMRAIQIAEIGLSHAFDRNDRFVGYRIGNLKTFRACPLQFNHTGGGTKTGYDTGGPLGAHRKIIIPPSPIDRFIPREQLNLVTHVLRELFCLS